MPNFISQRVKAIKPSPTIAVSTRAQEMRAAGRDVINLGSGEPDFDTPEHIKAAAVDAIRRGETKYTAVGGTPALKAAICAKLLRENNLRFKPSQIVAATGAKQAIMNAMLATLSAGDEVVIPAPYWASYPDMVALADATPVIAAADSRFRLTPEALADAMSEQTKMALFNSPSNPSGVLYSADDWRAFAAVLDRHPRAVIVCDDIYEHIRYDGAAFATLLNVRPDFAARTVVINGVSKAYAMTGWRIGYAAAPEALARAMTTIQSQSTSNPCSIAQAAAVAALESGTDCIAPMLDAFARRRRRVTDGFSAIRGLRCPTVDGAFYAFVDAAEAMAAVGAADDVAFCELLLERAGVAAVPGSAFGYAGCFRVSFATSDAALEKALGQIRAAIE